jgi:hypothetical protein
VNAFTQETPPGCCENLVTTSLTLLIGNFWHPISSFDNLIIKEGIFFLQARTLSEQSSFFDFAELQEHRYEQRSIIRDRAWPT